MAALSEPSAELEAPLEPELNRRVEIMDIPYLHGDDIWTEYRIPNIDRISYLYLGFVSQLVHQGNTLRLSRLRLYFICIYIFR